MTHHAAEATGSRKWRLWSSWEKAGIEMEPQKCQLANIGSKILGNSLPSVIIQAPLTSINPPMHLKVAAVIGPKFGMWIKMTTFQCSWLEKQVFGTLLWLPFREELPDKLYEKDNVMNFASQASLECYLQIAPAVLPRCGFAALSEPWKSKYFCFQSQAQM